MHEVTKQLLVRSHLGSPADMDDTHVWEFTLVFKNGTVFKYTEADDTAFWGTEKQAAWILQKMVDSYTASGRIVCKWEMKKVE